MRLTFKLLVIDDVPDTISSALRIFDAYLDDVGFKLETMVATDLSERGIRDLARQAGRDYDLVIVDYNLGQGDTTGATAALKIRQTLAYTDIIFYSSDRSLNLLGELARQEVAGVFVAHRTNLDEALKGVAETIIGKAVDLNHMRGIAMAEVAEMDVLMEDILEKVFSSGDKIFVDKGAETLSGLFKKAQESVARLEPMVHDGRIIDAVTDSSLFSSAHKYMAVRRVAKCLPVKPDQALLILRDYEADIITNRNTLAHAKEDINSEGAITLRAIKRGKSPILINEEWMKNFRTKLHRHRTALKQVCDALTAHLASTAHSDPTQN